MIIQYTAINMLNGRKLVGEIERPNNSKAVTINPHRTVLNELKSLVDIGHAYELKEWSIVQ